MQIGIIRAIVVVGPVVLAGAAHADVNVNLEYTGKGAGKTVKIDSPLFSGDLFAGQLKHTITGGSSFDGAWRTFCTDLSQVVTGTPKPYSIVALDLVPGSDPMGAERAAAINDLYAFASGAQLAMGASDDLAAAFQLAIWEILVDFDAEAQDNGLDVTAGAFRATKTNGDPLSAGIMGHMGSLLGAVGHADPSGWSVFGVTSGQHQDQLIAVPAPGALALVAAGLLAKRRRRA